MLTNPYRQTKFLLSAQDISHFPEDTGREVAFVGKSNVGKSSVINAITNQTGLARTSKTPGRTQHINFFTVAEQIRLVDLPGYGFAKVRAPIKKQWGIVINDYFNLRQSLVGLVLIMDSRRPLTELDWKMIGWFGSTGRPIHCLLTKSDKLTKQEQTKTLRETRAALAKFGEQITVQMFSSLKKTGMDEAEKVIGRWLESGRDGSTLPTG